MVVTTCTNGCARCNSHTYATRLSVSAKGPVSPEWLVVRQIASSLPVSAHLLRRGVFDKSHIHPASSARGLVIEATHSLWSCRT
jgi:hypothetical protein